jgi:predicted ABC-type ATPase
MSPITGFSWQDHIRLALLNLVYGFMPMERWFEVRGGRTHLAGVQERLPRTITEMDIDDAGQMIQVWQNTQDDPLPANRLTWYVNEREGANWAGISLLRPCYTPWVLKHEVMRVHATSIRRFGMGVPSVSAPQGATPAQIEEAQRLAAGMRAGDTAGAGLPAGYEFKLTGLTGAAPDAVGFLGYLDQEITGSALASIIELAHATYGSKALGESFLDLFLLALQSAADQIGNIATYGSPSMPGLARALVEYNWGEGESIPQIVATDVGDRHEITATSLQLLVSCGALVPDANLESFIRDAWGLPERAEPDAPVPAPPLGGDGGGPAPAPQPSPPGPSETPPPSSQEIIARQGGRRHRRAAGAAPFRRQLTAAESAAGLDPEALASDLTRAADTLAAAWAGVLRDQRADLATQVAAAVDAGDTASLADLTAPDAGGAAILAAAMHDMAWTAANRVITEAATQRVTIDPNRIAVNEDRLTQIATARASLAGQQLAHAASKRALRVTQATPGDDAAQQVQVTLEGLSPVPLGDQLKAAMSAAANEGRTAAFTEADDLGPTYIATEILDANVCGPCADVDGTEFGSLDEASAAYLNGAYIDCEGELRCRGTFIANYPDVSVTGPPQPDTLGGEDLPEPEDSMAAWTTDGIWDAGRSVLHQQIVDELFGDLAAEDDPVAYFLGGGPASGKSSLPTPGGGLAPVIDPDWIKARLPEYAQMLEAGDSRAAAYVHEESSYVAGLARQAAADRQVSFVVDGTGDSSYAKMAAKVADARAGGATQVVADYVTVDTAEAIRRATLRAASTGRMVPEQVITSIHAAVTQVFSEAASKGLFDELRLWDNSGSSPVLIAQYTRTGGLQILDDAAYTRFLAKA